MRIKRALTIISLFIAAAFILAACTKGDDFATQKNYITVGCVSPLSGDLSKYSEGSLQIEEAAIEAINESGGIYIDDLERKLKIRYVIKDSQSTQEGAKSAATDLIKEDNVDVMICTGGTETAIPVSSVCEENKVPCFITGADLEVWNAAGPYQYCFNNSASLDTRFQAIYDALGDAGASSIALVAEDNDAGHIAADVLGQFCKDSDVPYNGAFFISEDSGNVKGLGGEGQAVICYMDGYLFDIVWQDYNLKNIPAAMYVLADDSISASDLYKIQDGTGVQTVYTPQCWDRIYTFKSSLTEEDGPQMALAWEEEYTSPVPELLGLKHAAVESMVDALKLAMSVDPDAIASAGVSLHTDTVLGPVNYEDDHTSTLPCSISKWIFDASSGSGDWIKELVSASRVEGLELEE